MVEDVPIKVPSSLLQLYCGLGLELDPINWVVGCKQSIDLSIPAFALGLQSFNLAKLIPTPVWIEMVLPLHKPPTILLSLEPEPTLIEPLGAYTVPYHVDRLLPEAPLLMV